VLFELYSEAGSPQEVLFSRIEQEGHC